MHSHTKDPGHVVEQSNRQRMADPELFCRCTGAVTLEVAVQTTQPEIAVRAWRFNGLWRVAW